MCSRISFSEYLYVLNTNITPVFSKDSLQSSFEKLEDDTYVYKDQIKLKNVDLNRKVNNIYPLMRKINLYFP